MVSAVIASAAVAATAPLLHNHALDSLVSAPSGVLHADGMTRLQLPMIVACATMIEERHVATMAIAALLIIAEGEADGIVTVALVKPVAMIREGGGWQNRGDDREDKN